MFKALCENNSVKHLGNIVHENEKLRKQMESVKTANEVNDEKLIKLKTELTKTHKLINDRMAELEARSKDNSSLKADIAAKTKELSENAVQMTKLQTELKRREARIEILDKDVDLLRKVCKDKQALANQVDLLEERLVNTSYSLERLEDFAVKMEPLMVLDL